MIKKFASLELKNLAVISRLTQNSQCLKITKKVSSESLHQRNDIFKEENDYYFKNETIKKFRISLIFTTNQQSTE